MDAPHTGSNTASNDAWDEAIRQYRVQKRKCDEENGVLRSILKMAKKNGINPKAIRDGVAAQKLDPDVAMGDVRDTLKVMALIHVPISREALFDWDTEISTASAHQDDLWDVGEAGYRAGRAGSSSDDCPYDVEGEFGQHWLAEWHKGASGRARELGPDSNPAHATRKKRGRKPRQAALEMDEAQAEYQVGSAGNGHIEDQPESVIYEAEPEAEAPVYVPPRRPRARKARAGAEALN